MIFVLMIAAGLVAVAAIIGLALIPIRWLRCVVALLSFSAIAYFSYQAGIMSEFLSISGKYNRPLGFTWHHVATSIQGDENAEAKRIASEMVSKTYIAPRRWRDKDVKEIIDLTK